VTVIFDLVLQKVNRLYYYQVYSSCGLSSGSYGAFPVMWLRALPFNTYLREYSYEIRIFCIFYLGIKTIFIELDF